MTNFTLDNPRLIRLEKNGWDGGHETEIFLGACFHSNGGTDTLSRIENGITKKGNFGILEFAFATMDTD